MQTILDFFVITSAMLGLFITVSLIITSFYKSKANNYLAASLFIMVGITLLGWHNAEKGIFEFLQGLMWEFLIPVTLFTYFLLQLDHPFLHKRWYVWLYLPFLISVIGDVFLDLDFVFNLYDSSFREEDSIVQIFYDIEDYLSLFYNIILMIWTRRLIHKTNTISVEKKHWLLRFNLFVLIVLTIWFVSDLEEFVLDSEYLLNLLWAVLSFLSWWVLYFGIFRLQMIVQRDEIKQYLSAKPLSAHQKQTSNTSAISKYLMQLDKLMEEEKLYKNPLLSRLDLANQLDISEGYLSQLINQQANKSVIQYVNEFRISHAKQLLQNPDFDKYSIEAIGMESGFKSKSAFYDTFKNYVQMPPGLYRKQQKQS